MDPFSEWCFVLQNMIVQQHVNELFWSRGLFAAEKSPYMLSAVSGSGKSSCLATFLNRIHEDLPDFNIFFHFVGAVPGLVIITVFID